MTTTKHILRPQCTDTSILGVHVFVVNIFTVQKCIQYSLYAMESNINMIYCYEYANALHKLSRDNHILMTRTAKNIIHIIQFMTLKKHSNILINV